MQIGNYVPGFTPSKVSIPRQRTSQPDHVEIVHPSTLVFPRITEDTLWAGGLGEAVVDEWEQTVHVQLMKDSTEEDPVVRITVQAHGKEYDFTRHIKDIDPRNASYAEMAALVSWECKSKGQFYIGAQVAPVGMWIGDVMKKQNFVDGCSRYISSGKFGPNITAQAKDLLALYQKIVEDGNFSDDDTKTSAASLKAMNQALQELMDVLEARDFPGDDMTAYSAYRKLADDALMDLIKLV